MKVYKVVLSIIDFDAVGENGIVENIEYVNYPNDCISPKVVSIEGRDIGEWSDDHPLNNYETSDEAFKQLFGE